MSLLKLKSKTEPLHKNKNIINYEPKTNLDEGIKYFCGWYKSYYNY